MRQKYEALANLIDAAIAINKKNRENVGDVSFMMPLQSFLKEYCTVVIDIGRQTGKTEYIVQHLTSKDAIISYNQEMNRMIKERSIRFTEEFHSVGSLLISQIVKKLPDDSIVYIDNASYFNIEDLNIVYKCFGRSVKQTFVLLG